MLAVAFDTLKLALRLRDEVKFAPEQAEKAAVVLADTFGDWQNQQQLATKADLREMEQRIETRFAEVHDRFADINRDINTRFAEVNNRFAEVNQRIAEKAEATIKWVVGASVAQAALIIGILKMHL